MRCAPLSMSPSRSDMRSLYWLVCAVLFCFASSARADRCIDSLVLRPESIQSSDPSQGVFKPVFDLKDPCECPSEAPPGRVRLAYWIRPQSLLHRSVLEAGNLAHRAEHDHRLWPVSEPCSWYNLRISLISHFTQWPCRNPTFALDRGFRMRGSNVLVCASLAFYGRF